MYVGLVCLACGAYMIMGEQFDFMSCQTLMIDLALSGLLIMLVHKIREIVREVEKPKYKF